MATIVHKIPQREFEVMLIASSFYCARAQQLQFGNKRPEIKVDIVCIGQVEELDKIKKNLSAFFDVVGIPKMRHLKCAFRAHRTQEAEIFIVGLLVTLISQNIHNQHVEGSVLEHL